LQYFCNQSGQAGSTADLGGVCKDVGIDEELKPPEQFSGWKGTLAPLSENDRRLCPNDLRMGLEWREVQDDRQRGQCPLQPENLVPSFEKMQI
jgi:hypothetical protein